MGFNLLKRAGNRLKVDFSLSGVHKMWIRFGFFAKETLDWRRIFCCLNGVQASAKHQGRRPGSVYVFFTNLKHVTHRFLDIFVFLIML